MQISFAQEDPEAPPGRTATEAELKEATEGVLKRVWWFWGLEFRVWCLGFRVQGLGVWGSGFAV